MDAIRCCECGCWYASAEANWFDPIARAWRYICRRCW